MMTKVRNAYDTLCVIILQHVYVAMERLCDPVGLKRLTTLRVHITFLYWMIFGDDILHTMKHHYYYRYSIVCEISMRHIVAIPL